MRYFYDTTGLCGFSYFNGSNTKYYTYVKDVLGNIVMIKDEQGLLMTRYTYDEWGNCTVNNLVGTIGNVNPFRYRGYYYDTESGLYYLMSRYYDPEIGQFISMDTQDYLDPETIGGVDLYAYCGNNPVNRSDFSGHAWYNIAWDWINTIAGFLNPISSITALISLTIAMLQGRWSDLKYDWDSGALNPFNQDAAAASNVKVLGFYKGSTVIRQSLLDEFSIAGTIWMYDSYNNTTTINHEFGHSVQERILGPAYLTHIAIPSLLYWLWCDNYAGWNDLRSYYSNPWERTADFFGGIDRTTLSDPKEKIISYKSNSMEWAIAENIFGPIVILFYLLFGY